MHTWVRLDPAVEARLEQLAQVTGRSKAYDLWELIEGGIDDLEDAYLGAAVLERIRSGKNRPTALTTWWQSLAWTLRISDTVSDQSVLA